MTCNICGKPCTPEDSKTFTCFLEEEVTAHVKCLSDEWRTWAGQWRDVWNIGLSHVSYQEDKW